MFNKNECVFCKKEFYTLFKASGVCKECHQMLDEKVRLRKAADKQGGFRIGV